MKVCTDSCLFGAWLSNKIQRKELLPKNILDIGTGTGLLSLMLAQKSMVAIDAVEIDEKTSMQACENFTQSPWHTRLHGFNADIKSWQTCGKYDLIISNPPFYENDLLSKDDLKNMSKHSGGLRLEELLVTVQNLLNKDGSFAVLLPKQRGEAFENMASAFSFFVQEKLEVQQTTKHKAFRTMFIFQKQKSGGIESKLSIKDDNSNYTAAFIELLKDYYLHLE